MGFAEAVKLISIKTDGMGWSHDSNGVTVQMAGNDGTDGRMAQKEW